MGVATAILATMTTAAADIHLLHPLQIATTTEEAVDRGATTVIAIMNMRIVGEVVIVTGTGTDRTTEITRTTTALALGTTEMRVAVVAAAVMRRAAALAVEAVLRISTAAVAVAITTSPLPPLLQAETSPATELLLGSHRHNPTIHRILISFNSHNKCHTSVHIYLLSFF